MTDENTAYWAALERGDRAAALSIVATLDLEGVTSRDKVKALVTAAQARIGDLWRTGDMTLGLEHTMTSINVAVMHWLAGRAAPPVAGEPVLLVACIDEEEHALAAVVLAEALLAAGRAVRYLDGATSAEELLCTVERVRPRAVLLSASRTSSLAPHRPVLEALRHQRVPVLVGGRAWSGNPRRALMLGATAYAGSVSEVLELLDTLPERLPTALPRALTPGERAADELLRRRLVITAQVSSRLLRHLVGSADRLPTWWPDLDTQLHHVVGCLAAAVITEDLVIMREAYDWLAALTTSRRGAPDVIELLWELLGEALEERHPAARGYLEAAQVGLRAGA